MLGPPWPQLHMYRPQLTPVQLQVGLLIEGSHVQGMLSKTAASGVNFLPYDHAPLGLLAQE